MYVKDRLFTLFLILSLSIISFQVLAHKDGGIVVKNAWVREAPPVSPVLAGYMTIENHTGKTVELTAVKSSAFQKIEIHRTIHKDGVASMEAQNSLPIKAEGKVKLKPGGTHLMLINPTKKLKAGDTVTFTLVFANGSKSIVGAPVKKARSMSSDHHHGHDKNGSKKHGHDDLEHGEHEKGNHHKDKDDDQHGSEHHHKH